MYVYLKFHENWSTNMGDMAKSLFLQFLSLSLLFLFFSLNHYLKNHKRSGLTFCIQVGSDDPTCSDLSKYF